MMVSDVIQPAEDTARRGLPERGLPEGGLPERGLPERGYCNRIMPQCTAPAIS